MLNTGASVTERDYIHLDAEGVLSGLTRDLPLNSQLGQGLRLVRLPMGLLSQGGEQGRRGLDDRKPVWGGYCEWIGGSGPRFRLRIRHRIYPAVSDLCTYSICYQRNALI